MIIFDLETLCDSEHRRHFIDKSYITCGVDCTKHKRCIICLRKLEKDQSDWQAFYEACDKDEPIKPVKSVLIQYCHREIEIWSGRCESVRHKTKRWLSNNIFDEDFDRFKNIKLKMRPIGDSTPEHELKEKWLMDSYKETKWGSKTPIKMVFESDPESIDIFRKMGIFVFDCRQNE